MAQLCKTTAEDWTQQSLGSIEVIAMGSPPGTGMTNSASALPLCFVLCLCFLVVELVEDSADFVRLAGVSLREMASEFFLVEGEEEEDEGLEPFLRSPLEGRSFFDSARCDGASTVSGSLRDFLSLECFLSFEDDLSLDECLSLDFLSLEDGVFLDDFLSLAVDSLLSLSPDLRDEEVSRFPEDAVERDDWELEDDGREEVWEADFDDAEDERREAEDGREEAVALVRESEEADAVREVPEPLSDDDDDDSWRCFFLSDALSRLEMLLFLVTTDASFLTLFASLSSVCSSSVPRYSRCVPEVAALDAASHAFSCEGRRS